MPGLLGYKNVMMFILFKFSNKTDLNLWVLDFEVFSGYGRLSAVYEEDPSNIVMHVELP